MVIQMSKHHCLSSIKFRFIWSFKDPTLPQLHNHRCLIFIRSQKMERDFMVTVIIKFSKTVVITEETKGKEL